MMITNVRVITQNFVLDGISYYIVRFRLEGMTDREREHSTLAETMYGTLRHDYVDDNGKLKRQLCLADFWAGKTVADAIQRRKDAHEAKRELQRLIDAGLVTI